jgi:Amt family ammonium transporter
MGWVDKHYVQLGYQLAGICAAFAWTFTLTCIILFLLNLVPGLSLRVTAEEEEVGLDDCQLGEFAYDYVEVTRHVASSTHSAEDSVPENILSDKPQREVV